MILVVHHVGRQGVEREKVSHFLLFFPFTISVLLIT